MKNQVFVCGTLFHVYISILKVLQSGKDDETETLLILNDHTPGIESLQQELLKRSYFSNIIIVNFYGITSKLEKEKSIIARAISRNRLSIRYVEENSTITDYYPFIKEAEINLFYNLGLVSSFFLMKFEANYFRMLEDGYRNYKSTVGRFKAFKRKYILRTVIGEGQDKQVQSIEVQFPERLPGRTSHKGKRLKLKDMQNSLSSEQKNELLLTFLPNDELLIHGHNKLLLITQPISEDRIVSEKKKFKIYNQILKQYANEYSIFIKTHPREVSEYASNIEFPFTEIPRSFPLEFLDFINDITFDLGVTVFSSAIENVKCINKKIFLGKDFLNRNVVKNIERE